MWTVERPRSAIVAVLDTPATFLMSEHWPVLGRCVDQLCCRVRGQVVSKAIVSMQVLYIL